MNFGIPYMGSKSKIAPKIAAVLPSADHFYDLFGGGFSITHAMLLYRQNYFKSFHFNEIRPGVTKLIQDAISGKYSYEKFKPDFIDRDSFFRGKENNAYIKLLWSFGNNGKDYLFSKEIEPYKKSIHNAVVFNVFDDRAKKVLKRNSFSESSGIISRRLWVRSNVSVNGIKHNGSQLEQLDRLEQLEQLERLQQLNQLYYLEKNKVVYSNQDYRSVEIKENSIVYCDIPYKGTAEYDKNKNFNHDDFFDWADSLKAPVFISEFNIADNRFKRVFNVEKQSLMVGGKTKQRPLEKIYVNKYGFNWMISNR